MLMMKKIQKDFWSFLSHYNHIVITVSFSIQVTHSLAGEKLEFAWPISYTVWKLS